MSDSDSRRPSLLHRLEYGAFRAIERLLARVPMADAAMLGRGAGRLFHALSPRYRRIVRRNLRVATAAEAPSQRELHALTLETFRRTGANFLAALRTPTLAPDPLRGIAISDGMELLGGRGPGRPGLIAVMPHMGNWEALTRLGKGYVGAGDYGGVYRPLNNPLMDDLTRQRRCADGARLFSRTDGFHAPAAMLRDGGVLGVLADQRAGGRGTALPFFGKLTTCSPLPELLARRVRAEVGVLTIVTAEPGRWRMVGRALEGEPTTPVIMASLEAGMRASLPDVFWFHDRWRTDPARPLSLFSRIDPAVARQATVPLRLLLTFPRGLDPDLRHGFIDRLFQARPDLRLEILAPDFSEPEQPAVHRHPWDPGQPPEHADSTLRRVDESHPAPLDGVLLFGSEDALARAARRAGLRAIIGLDVEGKSWTRSFASPVDREGWLEIADHLARAPKRNRR